MADKQAPAGKSAKTRSSINWPTWVIVGLALTFIVGVWVNNYRVSHAGTAAAPVAAQK